jgi:hypothetical protein
MASAEDRALFLNGDGNQELNDLESSLLPPRPLLSKSFKEDGKLQLYFNIDTR